MSEEVARDCQMKAFMDKKTKPLFRLGNPSMSEEEISEASAHGWTNIKFMS